VDLSISGLLGNLVLLLMSSELLTNIDTMYTWHDCSSATAEPIDSKH